MIVILDQGGCPVTVHASAWARFVVRVRSSRLDTDLASGASPDDTLGLALRAQMLERDAMRRALARAAQRVMAAAILDRPDRLPVPICRDQVLASAAEFNELIERLQMKGPVSAKGVAMARALLGDGGSPVYRRDSGTDLRASVRDATAALSIT
jgi:hypothetical protein